VNIRRSVPFVILVDSLMIPFTVVNPGTSLGPVARRHSTAGDWRHRLARLVEKRHALK